jgi:hypothetical protein
MLTQQPYEVEEAGLTRKTEAGWMDRGGCEADPVAQKEVLVMSASTLYRLGGLALMASFPVLLAGEAIHPPGEQINFLVLPIYPVAHVIQLLAWLLLLVGIPAAYARQAERAGWLGVVGFVLTMLFIVFSVDLLLWEINGAPLLAADPATRYLVVPGNGPSGGGLMANGALGVVGRFFVLGIITIAAPIVFGIATWRAGVLPRWSGILQIASWPLLLIWGPIYLLMTKLGFNSFDTLFSPLGFGYGVQFLGYAWAGYALWSQAASQTAPKMVRAVNT